MNRSLTATRIVTSTTQIPTLALFKCITHVMYIRFTVPSDAWRTQRRVPSGLFAATYRLAEDGRFEEGERVWFREEMEWFNDYLPSARIGSQRRAVCWFRGDAGEAISRVWRLVTLLRREGIPVRIYRTLRPGIVVYSDNLQVAAVPWRDTFDRARWSC